MQWNNIHRCIQWKNLNWNTAQTPRAIYQSSVCEKQAIVLAMAKLNHNDTPIPLCLLFVIFVHYMCNAANDSLTMHKKYNFLCQITISSFSLWFVTKAVINKVRVKIYDLRNFISIGFLSWCHISASSFGVFYWWAMTILILLVSYDNRDFIGELRQS